MPLVTTKPVSMSNGEMVTEFVDSVGTTETVFTFPTNQHYISIKNEGNSVVTVNVNDNNFVLQPWESLEQSLNFVYFSVKSSVATQQIVVRAVKLMVVENTKQLPDFITGTLAAGASINEPDWHDVDGYRTIIITTMESSRSNSSWYVDHQFNDVPTGHRFNFNGAANISNNSQASSIMDARLRYYRNYVRNDDVVPRSFIVKRRLFNS